MPPCCLRTANICAFGAHHGPIDVNLEKWPITRGWTAAAPFSMASRYICAISQSEEARNSRTAGR